LIITYQKQREADHREENVFPVVEVSGNEKSLILRKTVRTKCPGKEGISLFARSKEKEGKRIIGELSVLGAMGLAFLYLIQEFWIWPIG